MPRPRPGRCQATADGITAPAAPLPSAPTSATRTRSRPRSRRVAEELGAPTVLVNNAGVLRDNLLFKMTVDDWDTVMQVHLRGAFLMTRAAQRHMGAATYGRIVNLSSTSALGNRGQANYSAAKAGLQGLTKTARPSSSASSASPPTRSRRASSSPR